MKIIQLDHSAHQPNAKKFPICFLAHDIEHPMNIGSLFRVADALGVEKIFLTGSSMTPPHPKIRKTSRATEQYVAYEYVNNPLMVIHHLKGLGYCIVSLEITSTSIDINDFAIENHRKLCLVLGSENTGIAQELLDASDISIHIPMHGHHSSMNVSHACCIATHALTQKYL